MKYWNKLTLVSKIAFIFWTLDALYVLVSGESHVNFIQWIIIWLFGYLIFVGIAQFFSTRKKKSSAVEIAQMRLQKANQLANIVNKTCNFEEFINSYRELINNMEFLQSIENFSFFTERKPSEDLSEIKEKRPLTEKEFVDRYIYQCGKESLERNEIYFDRLLPETVRYINSLLGKSTSESRPFNNFDYMEGHDFEYFCADILKKNRFENVEVTRGSGDHGIDILAEKDGITYAIQCKCYSSNIGNAAIQQAHTGKSIYHKDIAVVLTNRYFTSQAKEEAAALSVKLWDRDKLNEMIGRND